MIRFDTCVSNVSKGYRFDTFLIRLIQSMQNISNAIKNESMYQIICWYKMNKGIADVLTHAFDTTCMKNNFDTT